MKHLTLVFSAVFILSAPLSAAELSRETIAAWNAYVARNGDRPSRSGAAPKGEMIDVPGGTIYHSSGSIVISNTTVDRVIRALMYPGTPPAQEDVLESRVLLPLIRLARLFDRFERGLIDAWSPSSTPTKVAERRDAREAT